MQDDLVGMSTEQLMLRDLLYEIPELLEVADRECREYQAGVFHALSLLMHKLNVLEIEQSRFARQMPDVEAWFLRGLR